MAELCRIGVQADTMLAKECFGAEHGKIPHLGRFFGEGDAHEWYAWIAMMCMGLQLGAWNTNQDQLVNGACCNFRNPLYSRVPFTANQHLFPSIFITCLTKCWLCDVLWLYLRFTNRDVTESTHVNTQCETEQSCFRGGFQCVWFW